MTQEPPKPRQEALKTDAQVRAAKCPPGAARTDFNVLGAPGLQLRVAASGAKSWRVRGRATGSIALGAYPNMSLAEAREAGMTVVATAKRRLRTLATSGAVAAPVDKRTLQAVLDDYERAKGHNLRSWPAQRRAIELRYRAHLGKPARALDAKAIRRPVERDRTVASKRAGTYISLVLRWARLGEPLTMAELRDLVPEAPRSRVLTRDEIRAIWRMPEGLLKDFAQAALYTCQRRGDLAGMMWSSVDLDTGLWRFTAQKSRSRAAIELPLSGAMLDLLAVRKATSQSDFVFAHRRAPLGNFDRSLKLAHEQTSTSDWHWHDLRRTSRTVLGRIGVPLNLAEKMIGHASGTAMSRVYDTHTYLPEMRQAFDDLARHLEGLAAENVVPLTRPALTG